VRTIAFTVGKAIEDFDECTKVHSSEKLDEILKQARSREAEEVNRDFEDYAEHTRIGPSEELARAMSAPTPGSMPAVGRVATANIVRRTSAVHLVAPRASEQMPSARGSGEMDAEPPRPKVDDDAFDEWDPDAPKLQARAPDDEPPSEKVTAKTQPLLERIPLEAIPPLSERSAPVEKLPAELVEPPARPSASIPPINIPRIARPTPMPMPIIEPPKRGWPLRWGAIAWAALLAITIGVGSVAYVKISRLERELASTKVQLQQERAARK
jgi:hypothetical protein